MPYAECMIGADGSGSPSPSQAGAMAGGGVLQPGANDDPGQSNLGEFLFGVAWTPWSWMDTGVAVAQDPVGAAGALYDSATDPLGTAQSIISGCISSPESAGGCTGDVLMGAALGATSRAAAPSRPPGPRYLEWRGGLRGEIRVGPGADLRIAPFGNRGRHPFGRWPHYHRRVIDRATGQTVYNQGIGRHRPWEPRDSDGGVWDRF